MWGIGMAASEPAAARDGGVLAAIYRYPVKGMSAEALTAVMLSPGAALPFDRAYAIENGPGAFDPEEPRHLPKIHFVMLMRNEQLAALKTRFDEITHTLTLSWDGDELVHGDLRTAEGRAAIEAGIARTVTSGVRGPPRIVSSPGHTFSDVDAKCVHIVNLESVRALEAKMGVAVNPLRFRPNVIIDGVPAWSEFDCVGSQLRIGAATLEVFSRTERCAATNVDPVTAARDLKLPSFLSRSFGHTDFGVYARVIEGGEISLGDPIKHVA